MRTLSLLIVLIAVVFPAHGAPVKPRPYTGQALLVMRPPMQKEQATWRLVLYREPGVGRLAEIQPGEIPLLADVVRTAANEYPVAVMGRKGNWVRIEYDEGGRTAWIPMERGWTSTPWKEVLPGRVVRLLPGVHKRYAALLEEPSPSAGERAQLNPGEERRAELVQGDWVAFSVDGTGLAWLRWRDESGRFLVSFGPPAASYAPQNR